MALEVSVFLGASLVAAILFRLGRLRGSIAAQLPFFAVLGRAWFEIAIGAIRHAASDGDPIFGRAADAELGGAVLLQAVGALAVLAGLWIGLRRVRGRESAPTRASWSRERAARAALVVMAAGLVLDAVVVVYLLRSGESVATLAQRVSFTNAAALSSPIYQMAQSYSGVALVGAVVLVAIGTNLRVSRIGVVGGSLHLVVGALLGGRTEVVVAAAILWWVVRRSPYSGTFVAHAMRRSRGRSRVILALLVLATGYIYATRFSSSPAEIAVAPIDALARPKRIDDAAYVLREVPEHLPHAGGASLFAGLTHAFPMLELPDLKSSWSIIAAHEFGDEQRYEGIAGSNISAASEFYLALGWLGVVVGGLLFGLGFGLVAARGRRVPEEVRLVVMAFVAAAVFGGASARPSYAVASFLLTVVVPLGLIGGYATRDARASLGKLLSIYTLVGSLMLGLILRRMLLPPIVLRAALLGSACVLGLAYAGCWRAVTSWPAARAESRAHSREVLSS